MIKSLRLLDGDKVDSLFLLASAQRWPHSRREPLEWRFDLMANLNSYPYREMLWREQMHKEIQAEHPREHCDYPMLTLGIQKAFADIDAELMYHISLRHSVNGEMTTTEIKYQPLPKATETVGVPWANLHHDLQVLLSLHGLDPIKEADDEEQDYWKERRRKDPVGVELGIYD